MAFAREFLASHPDFSSATYPGPALSTIARDMLENARTLRAQMQAEEGEEVPLEFVLRTVQLAVNILATPPGEREKLLRMAKDIDTELLRNLLDNFDLTESPDHMVTDLALLNSDQPGRERLLLLDVF